MRSGRTNRLREKKEMIPAAKVKDIPKVVVPDVIGYPLEGKVMLEYCKCCTHDFRMKGSAYCRNCSAHHKRMRLAPIRSDITVPMKPKPTYRVKDVLESEESRYDTE